MFFESDGFDQRDLDTYTAHYGLSPIRPVIADGPRISNVDGETEMDLDSRSCTPSPGEDIVPGFTYRVADIFADPLG